MDKEDKENKDLGNRFKELRMSLNLDQKQMSEKLGISNSLLSAIELGSRSRKILDGKFLETCLKEFRCDRETLLGERELIHVQYDRLKKCSESLFRIAAKGKKPVFVIGDLCLDKIVNASGVAKSTTDTLPEGEIGGQGFIIAKALAERGGFLPVLFGNTGTDTAGSVIMKKIEETNIVSLVSAVSGKSTGVCDIIFVDDARILRYSHNDLTPNDANDFSAAQVRTSIRLAGIGASWTIFVSPAFFARYKARSKNNIEDYDEEFGSYITGIMDILDFPEVPLVMKIPWVFEQLSPEEFNSIIKKADVFYTELETLKPFYEQLGMSNPSEEDIEKILKNTEGKNGQQIFVFFGGASNIEFMKRFVRKNNNEFDGGKDKKEETKYNEEAVEKRIGYLDRFVIGKFIKNVVKLP